MSDDSTVPASFADLGVTGPLLKALDEIGYETPSPIQAETIPLIFEGRDLIGQAQTGTGKTAAFALPLLARIDLKLHKPQVLVLTPTRELAIQVAEAFQRFAAHLKGFHVLPVYGGSDIGGQLRQLSRGAHVVVGTPGRVMDHMRRGTLDLSGLICLVLDEADEMLRMGFIEDVEWVLEQSPAGRQIALFSATIPATIRRIANRHLNNPKEITIREQTSTAPAIHQRYWMVSGMHKLDALTRILEVETFDGMIVFVRTKTATLELAEKLEARGFSTAPLNGDIAQNQRERTVDRLKSGAIDILVATDVAARGLDVDRISHVINYDVPYDSEAYIHRIGRTGRAGRSGTAILFIAPREKRMLFTIERTTGQRVERMKLPSTEAVNDQRIARFKQRITDTLAAGELSFFQYLVEQYQQEHNVPARDIAAALALLMQGDRPLLLSEEELSTINRDDSRRVGRDFDRGSRDFDRGSRDFDRGPRDFDGGGPKPARRSARPPSEPEQGMERYRVEIGHRHGVKPGNIVGAIANEAGLDSAYIGRINIFDDYSTVDLPEGMPPQTMRALKKVWVSGRRMDIAPLTESVIPRAKPGQGDAPEKPAAKKHKQDETPAKPSGKKHDQGEIQAKPFVKNDEVPLNPVKLPPKKSVKGSAPAKLPGKNPEAVETPAKPAVKESDKGQAPPKRSVKKPEPGEAPAKPPRKKVEKAEAPAKPPRKKADPSETPAKTPPKKK